jgi:hypothetical protein
MYFTLIDEGDARVAASSLTELLDRHATRVHDRVNLRTSSRNDLSAEYAAVIDATGDSRISYGD